METAKVDIRKLQILNDRISQCIEALNQVRLSVHGLSHTAPGIPFLQASVNPLAQSPAVGVGYPAYVPGFSHTTGIMGTSPATFLPGLVPGLSPFLGLSHASPEEAFTRPAWADPLLAVRIAQTFPYAQYPVPPVVTIY